MIYFTFHFWIFSRIAKGKISDPSLLIDFDIGKQAEMDEILNN